MNKIMIKKKNSKYDIFLNIYIALLFLLPQNMLLYLLAPAGLLIISNIQDKRSKEWKNSFLTFFLIIFISLLLNLNQTWLDLKSVLRALQLLFFFYFFGKTRSIEIYKSTIIFVVLYILLFQFASILHIGFINDISMALYPLDESGLKKYEYVSSLSLIEAGTLGRLSGIYHESNNQAIYLEILFILLLLEKGKFYEKRVYSIIHIVLMFLILIGIVAAGSRTSFIILLGVFSSLIISNRGMKSKIIMALAIVFLSGLIIYLGNDLRLLKVSEGMDNSFALKINILYNYFEWALTPLRFLFGVFSTQALIPLLHTDFPGTDFDLGNMFVIYGITFMIALFYFFFRLYKRLNKDYRVFFWIFLWMFSNTIIVNYRTSSIVLLLLSIFYIKSRKNSLR